MLCYDVYKFGTHERRPVLAEERWYTVEEIVDMLKVHEQTVRRWLRDDQLRGVLLGRKAGYRIRESDLDAFLAARENEGLEGKAAA